MGLFDSVVGAVLNQGGQSSAAGGGLGGLGGLVGMLASNQSLVSAVTGLLSNDGGQGGLGGLVSKFQQAGLGDVVSSWISSGPNLPVSGEQITSALGSGMVSDLASKLGMDPAAAAGQLSELLPNLVNQLTPSGSAPQEGLGNASDLMGMLGGLLKG